MLGQAISMLVPEVIGFKLHGRLPEGTTATDLVLVVTQILAQERCPSENSWNFFGPGLSSLSLPDPCDDRQTWAPEYWREPSDFFPVDDESVGLPENDRPRRRSKLSWCAAYTQAQGLFPHRRDVRSRFLTDTVELDLSTVKPSVAGPKRSARPREFEPTRNPRSESRAADPEQNAPPGRGGAGCGCAQRN